MSKKVTTKKTVKSAVVEKVPNKKKTIKGDKLSVAHVIYTTQGFYVGRTIRLMSGETVPYMRESDFYVDRASAEKWLKKHYV